MNTPSSSKSGQSETVDALETTDAEPSRWLDRPRNIRRLVVLLAVCCVISVAAELLIHRHAAFSWESWPGFYAVFGFVAYTILILVAKRLRRFISREEDYYD